MNRKLKRNLSTVDDREWWASVAEAAKQAPKLRLHEGDLARLRRKQKQLAEGVGPLRDD